MKKLPKAFSLIELSIVILIIGVLIAGITSASRLVRESKLSTARTLTQSAPVSAVKNLILWLEPTLDNAFTNSNSSRNVQDGDSITVWSDINPQSSIKYSPSQTISSSYYPTYVEKGINDLPTLNFQSNTGDTTGDFLELPSAFISLIQNISTYTVFAVIRGDTYVVSPTRARQFLSFSSTGDASSEIKFGYVDTTDKLCVSVRNDGTSILASTGMTAPVVGKPYLFMAYSSANGTGVYVNRTLAGTSASKGSFNDVMEIDRGSIGNNRDNGGYQWNWNGYISEIIIFDRVLKPDEQTAIQDYLAKKYSIS